MKPNSHEQSKRHTFDSFCKKVLKHEARDYYDELKRQRDREIVKYINEKGPDFIKEELETKIDT
ncbi:MAG: hypothetical protein SPE78_09885, partial [Actinobacillus minor]|nr:hypothetical protein [Actinobacillus minor]